MELSLPEEIWSSRELECGPDYCNYVKEFFEKAPRTLIQYLIKIKILDNVNSFSTKRVLTSLSELRRLYIFVNVACQHGLFIKNPVILTMEKSILPRASIALLPRTSQWISNPGIFPSPLPYQLKWEEVPIFREMLYEGRKLLSMYKEKYDKLDLEAEFIKALTNNSGGVDYVPTKYEDVVPHANECMRRCSA